MTNKLEISREQFESANPVPFGVFWSEPDSRYMTTMVHLNCLEYQGKWLGWQSAMRAAPVVERQEPLPFPGYPPVPEDRKLPPLIQTLHANGDLIEQHGLAGYVYVRGGAVDYDAEICISNIPGDTIGNGDGWEPVFFGSDFGYLEKVAELRQQALDRAQATIAQQAQMIADLERGRGEPVAVVRKVVTDTSTGYEGVVLATAIISGLVEDGTELYASQPAPVAVVLPEHCENKLVSTHYRNGWNACLDKVKELNQ